MTDPIFSFALRETTLTTSDSTDDLFSMESEVIERVVSHSTTEIYEITRLKSPIFKGRIPEIQNSVFFLRYGH